MRVSMLILAAVATSAAAQRMSDSLPDCAVDCLEQGVEAATDCALDDGDCICEVDNYRDTYDASTACVLQACGAARALDEVLPAAARFCSEVTDGATAPPVDESPSATSTTTKATTAALNTDTSATTTPTATPTESEEERDPSETNEPDAANAYGPSVLVGVSALVLGLSFLL